LIAAPGVKGYEASGGSCGSLGHKGCGLRDLTGRWSAPSPGFAAAPWFATLPDCSGERILSGLGRIKRGALWVIGGVLFTAATYGIAASNGGGVYLVASGAIVFGLIDMLIGTFAYSLEPRSRSTVRHPEPAAWTGRKPTPPPADKSPLVSQRQSDSASIETLGPNETKWRALLEYDEDIRAAADLLKRYGDKWLIRLGRAFFDLEQSKSYLPNIVAKLQRDAEHERATADEWKSQFKRLHDGSSPTEVSLNILWQAHSGGYAVNVQPSGTITAGKPGRGTTYLRSNEDIQRFANET